jgi:hypothetical protein
VTAAVGQRIYLCCGTTFLNYNTNATHGRAKPFGTGCLHRLFASLIQPQALPGATSILPRWGFKKEKNNITSQIMYRTGLKRFDLDFKWHFLGRIFLESSAV